MQIYHNPRCAKSRAGLKYLEEKGLDFEIVKYLETGLTAEEVKTLSRLTGKKPSELIRTHEKDYKDNYKGKNFTEEKWAEIIAENPKLLHRPVVIKGEKGVLAQPPEEIDKIL